VWAKLRGLLFIGRLWILLHNKEGEMLLSRCRTARLFMVYCCVDTTHWRVITTLVTCSIRASCCSRRHNHRMAQCRAFIWLAESNEAWTSTMSFCYMCRMRLLLMLLLMMMMMTRLSNAATAGVKGRVSNLRVQMISLCWQNQQTHCCWNQLNTNAQ